jgi:hypothetical protein
MRSSDEALRNDSTMSAICCKSLARMLATLLPWEISIDRKGKSRSFGHCHHSVVRRHAFLRKSAIGRVAIGTANSAGTAGADGPKPVFSAAAGERPVGKYV